RLSRIYWRGDQRQFLRGSGSRYPILQQRSQGQLLRALAAHDQAKTSDAVPKPDTAVLATAPRSRIAARATTFRASEQQFYYMLGPRSGPEPAVRCPALHPVSSR